MAASKEDDSQSITQKVTKETKGAEAKGLFVTFVSFCKIRQLSLGSRLVLCFCGPLSSGMRRIFAPLITGLDDAYRTKSYFTRQKARLLTAFTVVLLVWV